MNRRTDSLHSNFESVTMISARDINSSKSITDVPCFPSIWDNSLLCLIPGTAVVLFFNWARVSGKLPLVAYCGTQYNVKNNDNIWKDISFNNTRNLCGLWSPVDPKCMLAPIRLSFLITFVQTGSSGNSLFRCLKCFYEYWLYVFEDFTYWWFYFALSVLLFSY